MHRDHMMGYTQPTEGYDVQERYWWCAEQFPFGPPANRAIAGVNADYPGVAKWEEAEAKACAFERGDHLPDGTVRQRAIDRPTLRDRPLREWEPYFAPHVKAATIAEAGQKAVVIATPALGQLHFQPVDNHDYSRANASEVWSKMIAESARCHNTENAPATIKYITLDGQVVEFSIQS